MMTPSVSIAPVRPGPAGQKPTSGIRQLSLTEGQASYSGSEDEQEEDDEGEVEGIDDDDEVEEEIGDDVDEDGKKKKKGIMQLSWLIVLFLYWCTHKHF